MTELNEMTAMLIARARANDRRFCDCEKCRDTRRNANVNVKKEGSKDA